MVSSDVEAEPGGKLDGAQHPHRVFTEADVGIADGADKAAFEVAQAVDVVDDFFRRQVVKDRLS